MPAYINNLTGSTALADQDTVTKTSNYLLDPVRVTNVAWHCALKARTEVILQLTSLIVTALTLSGQSIAAASKGSPRFELERHHDPKSGGHGQRSCSPRA